MKKRRSAEQIVGLLRQADVGLGKGMTVSLPVAALIHAREPSIQAGSVVSRMSVSKKVFEVPSVIIENVMPVLQFASRANHGWCGQYSTPSLLFGRCSAREKPNFPMQSIGNNDGCWRGLWSGRTRGGHAVPDPRDAALPVLTCVDRRRCWIGEGRRAAAMCGAMKRRTAQGRHELA
jgi:hypothetical protein